MAGEFRKRVARIPALMALLGMTLGASSGLTGVVLTAATPVAAQQGNFGQQGHRQHQGRNGGPRQGQNPGQHGQGGRQNFRNQAQPHREKKKNTAAKVLGVINAIIAPPRYRHGERYRGDYRGYRDGRDYRDRRSYRDRRDYRRDRGQ